MRLYVLSMGTIDLENGPYILPRTRREGQHVVVPVPAYLVQTDDGHTILVDTGMPAALAGPRETALERSPFDADMVPYLAPEQTVMAQLALVGLSPSDVDTVICTHLDWDHCGENGLFTDARLLLQRAQYDAALAATNDRYDIVPWNLPTLRYETLDGAATVASGVDVIPTPGHIAGLQSVLVRLPRTGLVVLCGDAIVSAGHVEAEPWDLYEDPDAARRSVHVLRDLAQREGGTLIYGHDPYQWPTLRHAPEYYD